MNELMTRLSLYDMLSILLPGFLTIFLCDIAFNNISTGITSGWHYGATTFWIIAFIISYIIGYLIHLTSKVIFMNLRHNTNLSSKAMKKFDSDIKKRISESTGENNILDEKSYYELYYKIHKKDALVILPILESQLSFFRSMTVVGTLYILIGLIGIVGLLQLQWKCFIVIPFILTILCLFFSIKIRKDIYYFYYESRYYLYDKKNFSDLRS